MPAEPLVKAVAALKFACDSAVADASFAIFVIVAPASDLVKVVSSVPLACETDKITEPAFSDPRADPAVPKVPVSPLIVAPDKVATFELTVTVMR